MDAADLGKIRDVAMGSYCELAFSVFLQCGSRRRRSKSVAVTAWHQYRAVDNQSVAVTQIGPLAVAAAAAWIINALCGGVGWNCCTGPVGGCSLRSVTFVLGQMALHLVYGDVIFLYSLHFFPILLAIAAFGWFSPARLLSIVAALVFLVAGGLSNLQQFRAATEMAQVIIGNSPSAEGIVIVTAGGDALGGVPKFRLLADGQVIGLVKSRRRSIRRPANGSMSLEWEWPAYLERFVFPIEDIEDVAALEVEFVNDDWAGEGRSGDRNLFVTEVSVNTVELHSDVSLVTTAKFDARSLTPIVSDQQGARVTDRVGRSLCVRKTAARKADERLDPE